MLGSKAVEIKLTLHFLPLFLIDGVAQVKRKIEDVVVGHKRGMVGGSHPVWICMDNSSHYASCWCDPPAIRPRDY